VLFFDIIEFSINVSFYAKKQKVDSVKRN